jgi:hypothetical protein
MGGDERVEGRIEYFERKLADDPDNPTGLLALANEYQKAGRQEDEAAVLQRYVVTHEDDEGNAYARLLATYSPASGAGTRRVRSTRGASGRRRSSATTAWPRICGSRSCSWASRAKSLPLLAQPNTDTINELLEDYLAPVCGTGGSPQRVMDYSKARRIGVPVHLTARKEHTSVAVCRGRLREETHRQSALVC